MYMSVKLYGRRETKEQRELTRARSREEGWGEVQIYVLVGKDSRVTQDKGQILHTIETL